MAGRKSVAELSVVGAAGTFAATSRVAPPSGLTQAQRGIWLATVNSKPAEWFGDEHVPMLVEYVRHVTTSDMLTKEIESSDPKWMKSDEGMRRMKDLTTMRAREAGCINTLARSMRLTQQSVYNAQKAATLAGKGARGRKPWQQEN
jgi:hypothetical protein